MSTELQVKHWVGYLNNESFQEGQKQWANLVLNEKKLDQDLIVFRIHGNDKDRMKKIVEIEKLLQKQS